MGQIGTHPDDLQVMKGALFEVLKRFDGRFYLVGGTSGVSRASGVPEALLDSVPYAPQDEYAKVTADMDIGIVPLDISAFNQAKSALKGLEYAALGLPFVASPTDPYLELPELGLYGGIARKPAHWKAQLSALAASQDLRDEVGGSNREIMRDWTIENQYWRWVEAWESVV
jgi:Glycosyltransferase